MTLSLEARGAEMRLSARKPGFPAADAGPVGFRFPTTQPGGNPLFVPWTVADTDFWEVYGKATWTVNTWLTPGGYLNYADDWLGSGAYGRSVHRQALDRHHDQIAPIKVTDAASRRKARRPRIFEGFCVFTGQFRPCTLG
jgi:hypothetical protein